MPLAGDHDDVTRRRERHRAVDGAAAVGVDLHARARSLQDVLDDRERLLAARVVGRDDDVVGPLHGDRAHHGPLAAVAVAPGAEHADDPAVAEPAGRLEHGVERVGRVRVVDDDRERLALVDRLEPTGHAGHRPDALRQVLVVDIEEDARRDDAQHVLDVEAAAQRRLDLDAGGPEPAALRPQLEVLGPDLCRLRQPEGDERCALRLGELEREPAAVLVADVHRRRWRLRAGEEAALRLVVLLHRPVQVEVVLGEVGEHERVEAHAVEPVEDGAVGRRLDRDARVAGVDHLAEEPLEVDRLGRGVRGGPGRASDDPLDGADETRSSGPRQRARSAAGRHVVVLPFVPVTPATSSDRVGWPKKLSAATAIAARASSTRSCGTSSSSGRSTTRAAAPAATARGAKS